MNSNGKECLHQKENAVDKQIEYGSEEKNRKDYHLEYCNVCSKDMDTDENPWGRSLIYWLLYGTSAQKGY